MRIKLEVHAMEEKTQHGSILEVEVRIPLLTAADFGEQLAIACRNTMEELVTQRQRDAGWDFDELTYGD